MPSVRMSGRDGGGGGGGVGGSGAGGGAMEDNELEEGEHSEKYDADMDFAFPHLDERISKLIGYFKKDFDIVVMSAELKGKYYAYGTFLHDFEHSPSVVSGSKSPEKTPNHYTLKSPCDHQTEGTSQQVGTTASVSFNNDSTFRTQPLDLLINKNTCGSLSHAQDTRPQFDLIKSVNCYNKNAFTLHVKKISPANKSAGKNTALYNGLGLASPTSSMEENVDGEQSSALHDDTPEESPDEIFQLYISFRATPYSSPLLASPKSLLLQLENKKELEDWNINISAPTHGTLTVSSGEVITKPNVSSLKTSKMSKKISKESKPSEVKGLNGANDRNVMSVMLGKEIDIEAPKSRKFVSNALTVPSLHGSRSVDEDAEYQLSQEAVKGPAVSWSTTSNFVEKDKNESIESAKRELGSMPNCVTNKFSNGRTMPSKIKPKLTLMGGRKGNIPKDDAVHETQKDVKEIEFNVFKGKKDHFVGSIESIKSKTPHRVISCELDREKTQNRKEKSQKEHNMINNREQLPSHSRFANCVKSNGNAGSYDSFPREKQKYDQLECSRDDSLIPARHNLENIPATESLDRVSNFKLPEPASNMIKDNWVQCDKCHTWRLLPYGANVSDLPGEWICSMLTWLPGMNSCQFTEDETTKALRERYQLPISDGLPNNVYDVADTSLRNAESKHFHQSRDATKQSFSGVTKKKSKIKDQLTMFPVTNSLRENQNFHTKSRYQEIKNKQKCKNGKISEQYFDEGYLFDKNCKAKSNCKRGFLQDEQRKSKKQKLQESHDIGRKSATNIVNSLSSKALGKTSQRRMDSFSSKDSKLDYKEKVPALRKKSEAVVHIAENAEVKLPTAEKGDNARKRNMKGWLQNGSQCPVNDLEETSEMTKAKKLRIYMSDKQESSGGDKFHDQAEKNSQSNRILISCSRDQANGIRDSKAYNDMDRHLKSSTASTSSSSKVFGSHKIKSNFQDARDSPIESVSSDPFMEKQNGKFTCSIQNAFSVNNRIAEVSVLNSMGKPCDMQVNEANTKDKHLFSKIFGSSDDDGSPSENEETARGVVSTNIFDEQNSCENDLQRHETHYNANGSKSPNIKNIIGKSSSLSRGVHTDSKREKGKMKASEEYSVQDDLPRAKNDKNNTYGCETDCRENSNYEDLQYNNLEEKELKDKLLKFSGSSSEVKKDSYSISRIQENNKVFSSLATDKKNSNSKVREISRNDSKLYVQENSISSQEDKKPSEPFIADQMNKLETTPGKVKSANLRVNAEKHDSKYLSHQPETQMPSTGISADIILKEQLEIRNGANHNSMSNLTSNKINDSGSVRKGGQSADDVYKEARSLKHSAENLKQSAGDENESIGLNFQSALKFLNAAFLMEHSQRFRSIQLYSETAKFFLYCAHEYEKLKEVAASALAYKCMEVAYMKVIYSMNPGASKDRNELQNAMQIGGSPSSSASDVDNLSTLSKIDKVVSVKGGYSSNIPGNLVIASHNRPNFTRLLGFALDVNSALDASKKALNALANYSSDHKDSGGEAVLSVKRVLDFNFHDIEGLLRLVRLSMELIGG